MYPSEDELKKIEEWPGEDLRGWFSYIKSVGEYWPTASFGWHEVDTDKDDLREKPYHAYLISTGGWSGNEDIIAAMEKNFVCWVQTWYSSTRGGHYEFRVRPDGRGGAY